MQKLSRSKIELFFDCPRCFWLDVKKSVKRPQPAPYTINNAIDYLLKQEFDLHREAGTAHPIMVKHGIRAVPFAHPDLSHWRHNFTGVRHHHKPTDFLVTGAVDDVWADPTGQLYVVDYKATGANQHQVYDSYRRQMEVYQWLLRQNKFSVSDTGYFVFARVNKAGGFRSGEPTLSFDLFLEPHEGDDVWVPQALQNARNVFDSEEGAEPSSTCEYCKYRASAGGA